jgi:PAS domain S-box-containing protein
LETQRNDLRAGHRLHQDLAAFTQRVIDAMSNLVIVLDTRGDIVRVNRSAADYLGLPLPLRGGALLDYWLARSELALLSAALPPIPWTLRSVVLETARSAGQYRGAHRLRSANGSYRYFLFEATLLHNRQSKEEGVVVSATDITAMKEAEVALRLAASVFDSSLNGIIIADADTVIQRVNPAFTEVLGYTAAEMISQRPRMLQSGQHDDAFYRKLWEDLNSHGSWQGEIIDRHKDGRLLHIWQSISAVLNSEGNVSHYEGSFFDITAIKNLELELREARDAAETAARAKGDFVANMSHEIRTPMNGIIGMLKLLTHTELDALQFNYVSNTQSAAFSLLGILNDILDYSKVAAGKLALDQQEFVLNGLMPEIAVIASANLGAKPIELIYVLDPELPASFVGDALRLKQVLTNLIGNTIKFTPAGEIVVHIDLIESSQAGVEVEFSVRDTGIGIAADKLQKIFESFSQAESSTTRKFGGTGLGLAISQSLVALMGGQLQVASEEGQGSRFFFRIRLESGSTTANDRLQPFDPDTGFGLGHRIRTLVVDDSTIAREEIRRMVDRFGWNVDTAASGGEALQKIALASQAADDYQLIFMDWQMPGLDGLATTRHLRELESPGHRPVVILLTGFDPQQILQTDPDSKQLFDAFLVKPVTASAVFDAVTTTRAGNPPPIRWQEPVLLKRLAGLSVLVV